MSYKFPRWRTRTGDVVELDRLEIAWAEEQMDADLARRPF